jgi:hypothetical protein
VAHHALVHRVLGQEVIDLLRAGQDSDELEYILVQRLNSPEAVPRRGAG